MSGARSICPVCERNVCVCGPASMVYPEVERLRALLAEARDGYIGHNLDYSTAVCDECSLAARIDAALAEPVVADKPTYACEDCGYTGDKFRLTQHPQGDYDIECGECGSTRVDEVGLVLSSLVRKLDTAEAERDEARAEVERLKAKAEYLWQHAEDSAALSWLHTKQRDEAYRRGAEAMREAAARHVREYRIDAYDFFGREIKVSESSLPAMADAIRALPVPEEKQ